jgi:hypothetical protein
MPDRPSGFLTLIEDWRRAFRENYEIGFTDLDPRALDILHHHALLERALDEFLGRALLHPHRLYGLGFGHKIALWAAHLSLPDDAVLLLTGALRTFNDLRNAVAHGDPPATIDRACDRLIERIPADARSADATIADVATFLLGTIALTTEQVGAS